MLPWSSFEMVSLSSNNTRDLASLNHLKASEKIHRYSFYALLATLIPEQEYVRVKLLPIAQLTLQSSSVVNGFPVCGISFRFSRKNEIRKEYLGTGYCKSYYFRLSNG